MLLLLNPNPSPNPDPNIRRIFSRILCIFSAFSSAYSRVFAAYSPRLSSNSKHVTRPTPYNFPCLPVNNSSSKTTHDRGDIHSGRACGKSQTLRSASDNAYEYQMRTTRRPRPRPRPWCANVVKVPKPRPSHIRCTCNSSIIYPHRSCSCAAC